MRGETIEYRVGKYGNADRVELTNFNFTKDKDGYFLSAKFRVEDQHSVRELDIPKIRLRIDPDKVRLKSEVDHYSCKTDMWIDLGFGYVPVEYTEVDGLKVMYTEKILEEKYTEMSLDEIEKKLGYKVKIVNR